MDYGIGLISLVAGYLAGSINFARIITRWKAPEKNLEAVKIKMEAGEENEYLGGIGPGAAGLVLGPKMGVAAAILDILKVVIPMLALKIYYLGDPYYLIAGFGGLLGHNWPIYYRFKGGRGVSILLGSFLVLDWVGTFAMLFLGFFLVTVFIGSPILSFVFWIWLMIPWAFWRLDTPQAIFVMVMNVFFLISTIPEMSSMLRLKRTGKYDTYSQSLYNAKSELRWMKEMTDRFWILRPIFNRRNNSEEVQSS